MDSMAHTTRQRLGPVPRDEWSPETRAALKVMSELAPPNRPRSPTPPGQQPRGSNLMGLFANHPKLTRSFFTFNGHILYHSSLDGRSRELLVLRVSALRRAEYEWLQHVQIGRQEGLTDAEIERVIVGPSAEGWSEIDRALLSAADELIGSARIGDDTHAVLADAFDGQQLMDIVFTVGTYETVAMAMRTFDVEPEDSLRLITPALPDDGAQRPRPKAATTND